MAKAKKILLVDGAPKSLVNVLPMYGYEVVSESSAEKALEHIDSGEVFDMILSEVILPKMNGFDFVKSIRKSDSYGEIPLIFVTSEGDNKKMVSGLDFGADDYIVKPYALPNLLARMEAVLRRSKRFENNMLPSVTNKQKTLVNSLTAREKDVLLLVTQGLDNNAIAKELYVSIVTVKAHLQNIFKKIHVKNRTQAVLFAMEAGLTSKEN